jgi:hypothetical protein
MTDQALAILANLMKALGFRYKKREPKLPSHGQALLLGITDGDFGV